MSPTDSKLEPLFSNTERDELGHLDYLLERLAELRDRGLIAPDSYATAAGESRGRRDAIDRGGQCAACLSRARALALSRPGEAIAWAEQALKIDRGRIEAWQMIVSLRWSQEDDEAAIARCAEGARHFPDLEPELTRMRREEAPRANLRRQRAEKEQLAKKTSERLADVRNSLREHRFADAAVICQEILSERPDQLEALANGAFALRRDGKVDEALRMYEQLVRLQPNSPAWPRWVQELRKEALRSNPADLIAETAQAIAAGGDRGGLPPASDVYVLPERSWTSFSSEFVKEHWQKLILCLAVLLIVVSSTVGAHILLGDLLWSREGKCTLALAGTLLLAGLGVGLEQWGAGRAGRMMLITTLIVVPIHFMLAGELRLLLQPPSSRLVFLAGFALILVAMVRWVSGRLAEPRGLGS